jgi:CheY-like chemotaxis protein
MENQTALLVDDEADSRAAHQTRLEAEGHVVFVALNQADALSRAKQTLPKIIYAHLGPSGLGNLALIQALRSDDACRHIPVVIIKDPTYVAKTRSTLYSVPHDSW